MPREEELALRNLVERFFHAIDRVDLDAVASCFTPDVETSYLGGLWKTEGRDDLMRNVEAIRTFACSTHSVASAAFEVRGDAASGTIFAIATVVLRDEATILVRGLQYVDQYQRSSDGWLISHRRQDPLWQYNVPAVAPHIPGI